ncbi:MAG: hypothetical protein HY360_21525 [Verrucomicrobia bacterium]|nr:hypothetical protein [Verrucomicrobiota bacterium]
MMCFIGRFCCVAFFGMLMPLSAQADRVGNFEVMFQPLNKESAEVINRGGGWTEKEKSQTLVYKVRIDYKGLDKLEDIVVRYIVVYKASSTWRDSRNERGPQVVRGEEKIVSFGTHDKFEFETTSVEHVYTEHQWQGGRSQYGKAQLKGIAIKILQGEKILAEIARPDDMKQYWKREESSVRRKSDDE